MAEFDEKAATWDDDPVRVERAEVIADAIAGAIDLSKVNNALEYGSGTGLLGFALRDRLQRVVLMDESEEMIKIARLKAENYNASHFEPKQYDLMAQPLPEERFDLIFILLTLHHIDDTRGIIGKFAELLNPGGYLAIIDLDKEDGSFHEGEFHGHFGFDRDELEAIIKDAGLTPVSYEYCYELTRENDDGVRKYPLFLMVSKK